METIERNAGRPRGVGRRLFIGCLIAATLSSCAASRQDAVDQVEAEILQNEVAEFNQDIALLAAQAASRPGDYLVGPEDLIEVTLYDIQDLQGEPRVVQARVSNTGYITLPYIGKVRSDGMTPLELEESLRRHYLAYIHEPQISVFIKEYRSYRVSVVGYVEAPGMLELKGRKTLLEAIGLAGGLNEEAGRTVRLTRQAEGQVQSVLVDLDRLAADGDIRLNVPLLPGDVINVPRAGIFYVEGVVRKPGAYPLLDETTVTQALATAGGIDTAVARTGATTLYRKDDTGDRYAVAIDLAAIRSGTNKDFFVQPDDVIVVPLSGPKFFLDRLTGLLRIGVNSAL